MDAALCLYKDTVVFLLKLSIHGLAIVIGTLEYCVYELLLDMVRTTTERSCTHHTDKQQVDNSWLAVGVGTAVFIALYAVVRAFINRKKGGAQASNVAAGVEPNAVRIYCFFFFLPGISPPPPEHHDLDPGSESNDDGSTGDHDDSDDDYSDNGDGESGGGTISDPGSDYGDGDDSDYLHDSD